MKILKCVAAWIAALVVWFLVLEITWIVVGLIGNIPIIGPIIYLGDVAWAQAVLSATAAVSAGTAVSLKICGRAKAFCWTIIGFGAMFLAVTLFSRPVVWLSVILNISSIMTAFVFLSESVKK